ncbi:MAG TPA: SIMPL domain-containing protein [Vicinamibacterales bacterium]|jgi:uncharacterized protein YggE|nr:SIMPL domain-containing protein [Vicinamibacterales bacterium]
MLLLALLLLAGPIAGQERSAAEPAIVTTGEATVRRAPDEAFVAVAAESRAKDPREAQRANAGAMAAVEKRLADLGIPRDALRTTGLRLEQEFDVANGRRIARDFLARNTLEVRVDEVARAGEVADAAVAAGATAIESIRFDLKERAAAEREALRLAVVDARARAEAAAAGAGRTLDRILRIEEGGAARPGPRPMAFARAQADVATPIEAGPIEITSQVTLTVAIK